MSDDDQSVDTDDVDSGPPRSERAVRVMAEELLQQACELMASGRIWAASPETRRDLRFAIYEVNYRAYGGNSTKKRRFRSVQMAVAMAAKEGGG